MDDLFKKAQKPWVKYLNRVNKCKADYHNICRIEKTAINQEKNALSDSSLSKEQVSVSTFLCNQKSTFSRCSWKQTNKGRVRLTLPHNGHYHLLFQSARLCLENHPPAPACSWSMKDPINPFFFFLSHWHSKLLRCFSKARTSGCMVCMRKRRGCRLAQACKKVIKFKPTVENRKLNVRLEVSQEASGTGRFKWADTGLLRSTRYSGATSLLDIIMQLERH